MGTFSFLSGANLLQHSGGRLQRIDPFSGKVLAVTVIGVEPPSPDLPLGEAVFLKNF